MYMLDSILGILRPRTRVEADVNELARMIGAGAFDQQALKQAPMIDEGLPVVDVDVYTELQSEGLGAYESQAVDGYTKRKQEVIGAQQAIFPYIQSGNLRRDELIATDLVLVDGAIERVFSHYPFPEDAVSRWTVADRVSLEPG